MSRRYYRRRRGGYRRYRRKPKSRFFSTAGKALATAGTALALARGVKSLINVEFKSFEGDFTQNVDNTGYVKCLNLIAQGDDQDDRDGDSIRAKGLSLKYRVAQHASATTTQVRVLVIRDNDQNGSADPAWTVGVNCPLKSLDVFSFRNLDSTGRFTVLRDRTYTFDGANHLVRHVTDFIKLNHHIKFVGSTAATNHMGNGSIYVMILSNEATNTPQIVFDWRLRFIDN